jgi:hypothetical protein
MYMDTMQRPAASPNEGKRHRKKPLNKMFDANSAPDDVKKLPPKVTPAQLRQMTVDQIRKLVRSNNYHFAIKQYSAMRKEPLIDKFVEHHNSLSVKPKPHAKRKTAGPKLTAFDKAMGLDKPLYKEGVAVGAKKQFEKAYGKPKKSADAQFLIDYEKKMRAENNAKLGRGKRAKKPTAKGKAMADTLGAAKVVKGRRKK